MRNLVLPTMTPRRLPFYLAMEEWAACELPPDEYFFVWRVAPTVICGRNQNIGCEVNLEYCREAGIDVVRRRSGGGAVYADMNNYMFSYIAPGDDVAAIFAYYTSKIASMLISLGLEAEPTGRNDIIVGGRKIAGNAFYHTSGRSIVHGTMLYDVDTVGMMRAITPSRGKLESKGVASVPSRVTSLRACGICLGIEEFGDYAVKYLCDGGYTLTPSDLEDIKRREQSYYREDFLYGHDRKRGGRRPLIGRSMRIDGVGEFELAIDIDREGLISAIGLWGDFFICGDMESDLLLPLRGIPYERRALAAVIDKLDPATVVSGLTKENLLNLLI